MARRADHSREELKELILEAAWKIIGQGGSSALTARSIAAEIGYTPGTIYNVFESMDALCLHLNGRTLDMLYKTLSSNQYNNPSKSTVQNLKSMAAAYSDFTSQHRPYWLMLFNVFSVGPDPMPWYQEKIDLLFTPLEKLLQPLFTEKQNRQRKIAARTLWASVHGLCILQATGKIPQLDGKETSEEMSSCLIDNFIAGLSQK